MPETNRADTDYLCGFDTTLDAQLTKITFFNRFYKFEQFHVFACLTS
jgi:hypothetical protein